MAKKLIFVFIYAALALSSCTISVSKEQNSQFDELTSLLTQAPTIAPQTTQVVTSPQTTSPAVQPTVTTDPLTLPVATSQTNQEIDPAYQGQPCDAASFVEDVTIPDYTEIKAGASFLKTWRIKNEGSCVWNSNYKIVFDHGDQMSAPAEAALISNEVYPGQTADVSVMLTAPQETGYYETHFLLKNPSGVEFGVSSLTIYSLVEVVAELTQPISDTNNVTGTTISIPVAETKTVFGDNVVSSAFNLGDLTSDKGAIAFARFSTNTIPTGATILKADLQIGSHTVTGSPFNELGCIRVYSGEYFPADITDYTYDDTGEILTVCDQETLKNPITFASNIMQEAIANGELQIKMYFNEKENNLNGMGDLIRITPGSLTLQVTYQ